MEALVSGITESKDTLESSSMGTEEPKETLNSAGNMISDSCYLLEQIFLKLPIKSIVRFKSVSTSWNYLISEPTFSEYYAEHSKFTSFLSFPETLSTNDVVYLHECSENQDLTRTPVKLKLPDCLNKESRVSFVGMCNGFLCLVLNKPVYNDDYSMQRYREARCQLDVIYIINPLNGDCITLPERKLVNSDSRCARYLFDFCSSTNNFAVLRFASKNRFLISDTINVEEAEILKVGVDDKWRRLSVSFSICWDNVIAFNGTLCWISGFLTSDSISTFDISEEKLGRSFIPPDFVADDTTRLGVFDNQLLVKYADRRQITLWSMEKDSTTECWTKIIISRKWLPLDVDWYFVIPVAMLKHEEILFSDIFSRFLISFNIKQKRSSKIDISAYGNVGMQVYAPKFFSSPKSHNVRTK